MIGADVTLTRRNDGICGGMVIRVTVRHSTPLLTEAPFIGPKYRRVVVCGARGESLDLGVGL